MAGHQSRINSITSAGEDNTAKSKKKSGLWTPNTPNKHLLIKPILLVAFFFSLYSQPLDVVLRLLGDELNSLQDVSYVIDASFLDIQDLRGPVQIHHTVSRLGQEIQKALGGQVQGSVIPGLLRCVSRNWIERESFK